MSSSALRRLATGGVGGFKMSPESMGKYHQGVAKAAKELLNAPGAQFGAKNKALLEGLAHNVTKSAPKGRGAAGMGAVLGAGAIGAAVIHNKGKQLKREIEKYGMDTAKREDDLRRAVREQGKRKMKK